MVRDADIEEVAKLKTLRQVIEFLERRTGRRCPAARCSERRRSSVTLAPWRSSVKSPPHNWAGCSFLRAGPYEDQFLNDHCFDPPVSSGITNAAVCHSWPMTAAWR